MCDESEGMDADANDGDGDDDSNGLVPVSVDALLFSMKIGKLISKRFAAASMTE